MVISRSASPAQEEESILWLGNRASAIERYFTPARRPSTTRSICGIRLRRCSVMRLSAGRSEEHTSELQSLMRISYAVFCLKKKNDEYTNTHCKVAVICDLYRQTSTYIRH